MATSLLRSEARALARLRVRDSSTTTPGITDANWNLLIEEARQFYASMFPEQFIRNLGSFNTVAGNIAMQATIATGNVEWRSIESVLRADPISTPTLYTPLRYADSFSSIMKNLVDNSVAGPPEEVFVVRSAGSDTLIDIYLYPIPDAIWSLQLWGLFEPAILTADSDPILFGFHGSRVVAKLAALTASMILGRPPEFVQGIQGELPDRVRTRMDEDARSLRPIAHAGKSPG